MINTTGLTKVFGHVTAVDNVSLVVEKGNIFGLVGPDGAGKTTLLRMLCGILPPTGGNISLMGAASYRNIEWVKANLGYMPQRFSLYGDLTVAENIFFFGRMYSLDRTTIKSRGDEILETFGLAQFRTRLAANLSGGMKQKLALTCALLARPRLLVLDEPTYGIDPESRKDFWMILYRLNNNEGITILVSTPYMDEADLCRKVAFINNGKLAVVDTPANLKKNFKFKILELHAGIEDTDMLDRLPEVIDAEQFGDKYHIWVTDPEKSMAAVSIHLREQNIPIYSLKVIRPSMEDIFVSLAE